MPRAGNISRIEREKVIVAANAFCAFPRCFQDLTEYYFDHGMAPKISHIVAAADDGPRGDASIPEPERNAFANLILLCDEHARAVDAMPVTRYTVECLLAMKADHEARVRAARSAGALWSGLVGEPNYVNLNRLFMDARPSRITFGMVDTSKPPAHDFESMAPTEFAQYVQFASDTVSRIERTALRLTSRAQLVEENEGKRFIFWRRFYTKNIYDGLGHARPMLPDVDRGPHVYTKVEGVKVIMPIDARWVTSRSAKCLFAQGTVNFAGVATLRTVDGERAIMSPIVLGKPTADAWTRFEDLRTEWFRGVGGGSYGEWEATPVAAE